MAYKTLRQQNMSPKKDDTIKPRRTSSDWIRFEEVTLNTIGRNKRLNAKLEKNLKRYEKNAALGLEKDNITIYNGKEIIIDQSGGNFPYLKFHKASMKNVSCEIIAAYNALILAGKKVDFFKLAFEFELNATLYTKGIPVVEGCFGSDPFKIAYCLEAYNASYEMIHSCAEADKALKNGKSGIISYRWPLIGHAMHLPIHTFSAVYDGSDPAKPVKTFNRYSNHTKPINYLSIEAALNADHDKFIVGYVMK